MAKIIEVDNANADAVECFAPYIQSGVLSFLMGSGASSPAIATAGAIESEIDALLIDDEDAANTRSMEFIEGISALHVGGLANSGDPNTASVLGAYKNFTSAIDAILFARKSILLPRQANLFTTNYDLFIESAASEIAGLLVNDGFDRSTRLSGNYSHLRKHR